MYAPPYCILILAAKDLAKVNSGQELALCQENKIGPTCKVGYISWTTLDLVYSRFVHGE